MGTNKTVIVMNDGDVYAAGCDDCITETGKGEIYREFIKISAFTEEISWAVVGDAYILYLTMSGKAILSHKHGIDRKFEIQLQNRALAVFGGLDSCGIIDEDGCAYFIEIDNPYKTPSRSPTKYVFDSPVIELVCCSTYKVALLSDFRVMGNGKLNSNQESFALITSLLGDKITKISGLAFTCLALTKEGFVFGYGSNSNGQLGNNSTTSEKEEFIPIKIPGGVRIKDIASSAHSFFLSSNGELFGCGSNEWSQLFYYSDHENVMKVTRIDLDFKIDHIFVGYTHSIAVSGANLPNNPAKEKYVKPKRDLYSMIEEQNEKIEEQNSKIEEQNEKIEEQNEKIEEQNSKIEEQNEKIEEQNDKIVELRRNYNEQLKEMRNQFRQLNEALVQQVERFQYQISFLIEMIADQGLNIIG